MSPFEDEIEAITHGAGMPDRADQGWIELAGEDVLQVARQRDVVTSSNKTGGRRRFGT